MTEEETRQELLDILDKGEQDFQEGRISSSDTVFERVDVYPAKLGVIAFTEYDIKRLYAVKL